LPIRLPLTVNLNEKEAQREKPMEKAYGRWAVLEERIWVIEASSLYYPIKTTKICLVPNVVVPKYF
jgi:hypothetical protein